MAAVDPVDAYFEKLALPVADIAAGLRAKLDAASDLTVGLAWNFPCWSGQERLFSVIAHAAHCNLQLWNGARLAQHFPARIEGTGKALRHVKVRQFDELDPELDAIIAAAIELDQADPQKVR